ncbi:MAG: phenylacetate--CoA ligase family protein [Flavobacteriaceae bacterium]|nr:phenylacetate--CoA ligase family protein [Flavobacteriaceae bacterium]
MNTFEQVLKWKKFPIDQAKIDYRQIFSNFLSNPAKYREKSRWEIFKYHCQNTEFYQDFLPKEAFSSWENIPVMTKFDLQTPLEKRISSNFLMKDLFVNKTSGSSGHPFIFAKDKYAHALTWAHIIQLYRGLDIVIGKSLEARFYGIPKDFMGFQKERLKDKFARRYRFDIFDLSEDNLYSFLKLFQTKKFEIIYGYTSSIVRFAKFLKRKNIVLKTICPSLKVAITTSEMLFPEDFVLLKNQFGVPIINEYGASELGVIAFADSTGKMWLNESTLYTEAVDEKGKPLPSGEAGQLLVTSLHNKAHPFIRYKIGDIGSIEIDAKTGRRFLAELVGRTNQFAQLPSGKTIPALSFYYVTKSVIEDDGKVQEIKVTQEKINSFTIEYVSEQELDEHQKNQISKAINQYLEPGLNLAFVRKTELERSKSGKLKQFVSKVGSVN